MKRLALVAAAPGARLPASAAAHPLGNFTVNRYAEVVVSGDRLYVRYALDLAEIPTFQDGARVRARGFAPSSAVGSTSAWTARRVPLRPLGVARSTRAPGAGGLRDAALRRGLRRAGPPDAGSRSGPQLRGAGRLARGRRPGGARRRHPRSDVPARSVSDALRSYSTRDPARRPRCDGGRRPRGRGGRSSRARRAPRSTPAGGLRRLVAGDLSAGVIAVSLLLALFWGAAHALSPGHGKAIVAGYLVGARGTARHALLLGAIVTVDPHDRRLRARPRHARALLSSPPRAALPLAEPRRALLVVGVGVGVVRARLAHARAHARAHHHHHDHDHELSHGRRPARRRGSRAGSSRARPRSSSCSARSRCTASASAWCSSSPSASASRRRSPGSASSPSPPAGALARRLRRPLVRALPAVSAVLVLALGLAMTARALVTLA